MKIAIIGAGSFGTALGIIMAKKEYDVSIWDRKKEIVDKINMEKLNDRYLPGVVLPININATQSKEELICRADVVILAVPSHAVRSVCDSFKDCIKSNQIIVNISKGIEDVTYKRMSEVIEDVFPENRIVAISGPSHAEEVSIGIPTAVVASSRDMEAAKTIQDLFITPTFRVYTNPDIIGVELGGAVKNIIALAAGISDGLGYGDNTKAALMTRGISEITRLGVKMGAKPVTFAGLSGIGDLIVTCTSMHSRNRRAGILIGKGRKVEDAVREVNMVVEGIKNTKAVYNLSMIKNVNMPITNELYKVLFENEKPELAMPKLMMRDKKHETEEVVEKMW